nr:sulfotransferase [Pleurocapsa sp. MO_192.B19]
IGTAKAGTSSVYSYLKQHPQIYMSPIKEPRFFAPELFTEHRGDASRKGMCRIRERYSVPLSFDDYCTLFQEVSNEVAIGEASTEYLYIPKTPERIKQYIPDVKLIAILRNPVERAFSAFCYLVRDGDEKLNFEQALREEDKRINQKKWPCWYYKQVGFYYAQVKRYFDTFSREQIKIYLYEDLETKTIDVVEDIYRFLGVDDTFTPDLTRKNISGIPKSRFLQDLFTTKNPIKTVFKPFVSKQLRLSIAKSILKRNLGAKPTLSPEIRQELIDIYREDILKLQELIQRDLSEWLA